MEEIKQYGDLSETELFEFLHLIESDDDDLDEAEKSAEQLIEAEEDCIPDEMLEDNAWVYKRRWVEVEDGRYKAEFDLILKSEEEEYNEQRRELLRKEREERKQKAIQKSIEYTQERKRRTMAIRRAAATQDNIMLGDAIPREMLTALITDLTSEHRRMMGKLHAFINKRLTVLLMPLIPKTLRNCAKNYPHSVMRCPGFMYKGSKEYGREKYFWATPDIPYYFAQGTEQTVLNTHKYGWMYKIDKAVSQYDYHKNALAEKEVKYASSLVKHSVKSFYNLLKYNPFWFERLYRIITKEELCTK